MLTGWGQQPLSDSERTPQVDRLLSKPPRLQELRMALAELTADRDEVKSGPMAHQWP
jgi:hypothetical protein